MNHSEKIQKEEDDFRMAELEDKLQQLEAENERLNKQMKSMAPVELLSGVKESPCRHSNYWVGIYGTCVACECESLRTQLSQAKAEGVVLKSALEKVLLENECSCEGRGGFNGHFMYCPHETEKICKDALSSTPIIEKEVRLNEAKDRIVAIASMILMSEGKICVSTMQELHQYLCELDKLTHENKP